MNKSKEMFPDCDFRIKTDQQMTDQHYEDMYMGEDEDNDEDKN